MARYRRRPIPAAMNEVETAAIEARELLAQLRSDGLDLTVNLPILGERTIHIQLSDPDPDPEPEK